LALLPFHSAVHFEIFFFGTFSVIGTLFGLLFDPLLAVTAKMIGATLLWDGSLIIIIIILLLQLGCACGVDLLKNEDIALKLQKVEEKMEESRLGRAEQRMTVRQQRGETETIERHRKRLG
jgi:predicted membrane protein